MVSGSGCLFHVQAAGESTIVTNKINLSLPQICGPSTKKTRVVSGWAKVQSLTDLILCGKMQSQDII